ncbi:MAG: hypothetical protein IJ468_00385 [Lachnospiraceae bacterium]|nr:hypothetical protein [Lachnospiraceae bacterium]
MKHVYYEWMKFIHNRLAVALVLGCICVNLFYQWNAAQKSNAWLDQAFFDAQVDQILEMSQEDAGIWLDRECAWYRFLSQLGTFGEAALEGSFMQLKMEYPEVDWNLRLQERMEDGFDFSVLMREASHFYELQKRQAYALSYPVFLQTIQKQADSMLGISLFSDNEGFSQKNILRTAAVYETLEGQECRIDYSMAVSVWSDSQLADGLVLILILIIGWQIFWQEKENGLYPLLRCTENGKLPLAVSKVIAAMILLTVTTLLLYGSQILLGIGMYGTGNLEAPLVSVSEFRNCPYRICIGTYLLLFLLVKVTGVFVFGSLVMLLYTGCRRFGTVIAVYFVMIGLEFMAYRQIDSLSSINGLKFINLIAVLDAKSWFTAYRNINIFSEPLTVVPAKLVFSVCVWIVCTGLTLWCFCVPERKQEKLRLFKTLSSSVESGIDEAEIHSWNSHRKSEWIRRRWNNFGEIRYKLPWANGTSLICHEGYNLYRLGGMWLMLLLVLGVSMTMAEGIPDYSGSRDVQVYQKYILQIQGIYTEETEQFLRSEELVMRLEDPEAVQMKQELAAGSVTQDDYDQWMEKREVQIRLREVGFQRVLEQERLVQAARLLGSDAGFADADQVSCLFQNDNEQIQHVLLFLIAVIPGITWLFGMEQTCGMKPLIVSTVSGRIPLRLRKLIQVIGYATLLYLILFVPYYWEIWNDLERVPADLLLAGVKGYENFPLPISICQAFWIMAAIQYLTGVSCSLYIAAVTGKVGTPAQGCLVNFLLLVVPCFLFWTGLNLSEWTCVGGFLPSLVYRSGEVLYYWKYLCIGILLDAWAVYRILGQDD